MSGVAAEAEDVLSLVLRRPDGGAMPQWEPGAHIDLLLPAGLERQYSLCGDPSDEHSWTVAVLHERDSRGGSRWIHTELKQGEVLGVRGPRCNFPLVAADSYLFIAGGIGITPLVPMIERLAAQTESWHLLYGGRRRDSMAFVERLARHRDHVKLWPEDEHGLLELEQLLEAVRPGTVVYCCGPEPLIAAVEEICKGLPDVPLRLERFHPRQEAHAAGDVAFEVVLEQSGVTIEVSSDQTVLEALESAGIDVPCSCREGTCGTCETDVLDGIVDHRDSFLSEEEREEGRTMMICCSRSHSPRLVLDL
ncbi:MAG TPA: PDR/VanB family oxidoreductase [Solirubrobacteraceae bacterium]